MTDPSLLSRSRDQDRQFAVCKDHLNADWNQPQLEDAACVLCRLFYLEAQESLLEEWQQRAIRAEETIKEIQRPLDAQMGRLNKTVERLNGELEALKLRLNGTEIIAGVASMERGEWAAERAVLERIRKAAHEIRLDFAEQPPEVQSRWIHLPELRAALDEGGQK